MVLITRHVLLTWVLAAPPLSATADSQGYATSLLHQALAAQGGEQVLRALGNVRWTLTGYRNELEQSVRPDGPYVTEFLSTIETHDFRDNRFSQVTDLKVYPAFAFSRGSVVSGGIAMKLIDGKQAPGNPEQIQLARERMALSPEHVLLTALDAPGVQTEADSMLDSVPQNVVAFNLDGAAARIYLNAYTHLPTAVDYSGPIARSGFWRFLGDVTARTSYTFWWLAKGGIHLPLQWNVTSNGLADQTIVVRKLQIDDPLNEADFAIPDDVRDQYKQAAMPPSLEALPLGNSKEPATEVSPGVILIPGAWNVTLIRQDDGVIILEAPISSGYSVKVIAEAHRRFPNQPIKAVVTTSDAWPHVAGIREYVAQGVPIYALNLNKTILERVIGTSHTSKPDSLQREPRVPHFRLVHDKFVIASRTNPLELYPIRGETSERQMMAYLPKQELLYGSDPFQRDPDGSFDFPQSVTELMDAVHRNHITVTQFFMMHIGVRPWAELQKAVDLAKTKDTPDVAF
jgi:hypothetical protein